MKQTLSIKLGQQLTMTPQLQQAIKLLQLSTLDLQQEIQMALESNPMLEMEEDDAASDSAQEEEYGTAEAQAETASAEDGASANEFDDPAESSAVDDDWEAPIPEDLPVDTEWDDIYGGAGTSSPAPADDDWSGEERDSAGETLQDHLLWQLNLTSLSDVDRIIGAAIIDAIDADGMLTDTVGNIAEAIGPYGEDEQLVEPEEVVAVLKLIQQFDPVGVGARDLGECLLLQLKQLPAATPWLAEAKSLVTDHLETLGARDFAAL